MSTEKFASLTASLLVRKGEAGPSAIQPPQSAFAHMASRAEPTPVPTRVPTSANAPAFAQAIPARARHSDSTQTRGNTITLPQADPDTIGFIAVKRGVTRSQLLRLALEGCGDSVMVPVGVEQRPDGSVTLTVSDSAENFVHDAGADGWVGNCGSFLTGDADLFAEATGWCITISLHQSRNPSVEICHSNQREAVKLDGFPAAMFS